MTLNELESFYKTLLQNITSEDNSISRTSLLSYVLPGLNLSRLTDSEEVSYSYFKLDGENAEIDAYLINETGERLQLFLSNLVLPDTENIQIARKDYYESLFAKAKNFFTKAVKKFLSDIQVGDPASVIIRSIESAHFQNQIDVVEIFLISNTISIETRGAVSAKNFSFTDDEISLNFTIDKVKRSKKIKIKYQLIDLNKIYNFEITEGNPEPIVIDFNPGLSAIKAADDVGLFSSYLAVIPASMLLSLYHDFSSRLLERNVRSFLQFKGVNQKLKETLVREPDKFIAYNNGLTITATSAQIEKLNGVSVIRSLTDFQIVNGGQTTASIYFSNKEGVDVSRVHVTAKINVVQSDNPEILDELISKISQYSNSQNKVSSVDLNSRSGHLVKIKKLSESITDPSGEKWFFERIRGDFNTLVRINPSQKSQIEKTYPKRKRLSKEQLAKYYVAWGTTPFLVRKGGEKVFRDFMDFIQLDHNEKPINPENMGRAFYEDLIAKTIMFKEFEQLYGSGPNAIGQIRSSVVPYALSLLYQLTSNKKINLFDLAAIWMAQQLPEDLREFSKKLLEKVHDWCKMYSKSDDVGEYAKKEELWKSICNSPEFQELSAQDATKAIVRKYSISESEFKKRHLIVQDFDFSLISENCRIFANGTDFYTTLRIRFFNQITENERRKLEELTQKLQVKHNLSLQLVNFEVSLLRKLQNLDPEWFLHCVESDSTLLNTIGEIINIYNRNTNRIKEAFEAERLLQIKKGTSEAVANAYRNIGILLSKGEQPMISDIIKISRPKAITP